MRLPDVELTIEERLLEFDRWITPSLGEIRDTEKFAEERARLVATLDAIARATDDFASEESVRPDGLARQFISMTEDLDDESARAALAGLASFLFLVTGKSDNNFKCQFPLFLRDSGRWPQFPRITRRRGAVVVGHQAIPRSMKAERVMTIVVALAERPDERSRLLQEFIHFVLSTPEDAHQLWAVGRSYSMLREFGRETDLLTPLVVFQVRGSVSASGGHEPEDLLRARLDEWGLVRGEDYNTTDVVVGDADAGGKTRAYDFVLPFSTPGWPWRVFVQCQFYAGDSGSVSHKNVDQAGRSRARAAESHDDALFVEYVDGAGYFSALNGDLKKLLSMADTHDFMQIRSTPIRLRRALQLVGLVTPLEVSHAVLRSSGSLAGVRDVLASEGYQPPEIARGVQTAIERGWVLSGDGGILSVSAERRNTVRRYFLLDCAAVHGEEFDPTDRGAAGVLAVPGYGPCHGMKIDDLGQVSISLAPSLGEDWRDPCSILRDLRWLDERGFAML